MDSGRTQSRGAARERMIRRESAGGLRSTDGRMSSFFFCGEFVKEELEKATVTDDLMNDAFYLGDGGGGEL